MLRPLTCSALALLVTASAHAQQAPFAEVAKVVGNSIGATDLFGIAVAISGDTALIGAQGASTGGAAFVFERQGDGSWVETQELAPAVPVGGDTFGRSVAIDGDRAIVGSTGRDGAAGLSQGAAFVFERSGGVWTEVAELPAIAPAAFEEFGWSVAIDGDFAAVGSYRSDVTANNAGSVTVFQRIAGTWTATQALVASDPKEGDQFGYSLALDGTTVLVGADREGPSGNGAGAAYFFDYNGSTWLETQKLKGSDTIPLDYFGCSVDVDGDRAAIGAWGSESAADPFNWDEGAVYVFERTGGTWTQAARLEAGDANASDQLGYSVAIDGDRVLAGSPDQDSLGNNAGAAYLFERGAGGAWTQATKLLTGDGQSGDLVGRSVGLAGDVAIAGARGDDDQGSSAGAAYLLDVEPLSGAPASISLGGGGSQVLTVDAGSAMAGDFYWVLGSATGSGPGIPVAPGFTLPLGFDAYFELTLATPNQAPLSASLANLNSVGRATATFTLPPGTSPSLTGLTVFHAFFVFDSTTFATTFTSNPSAVVLAP